MIKRFGRSAMERIGLWMRRRRERNHPEYHYLSQSVDLVDLEHRMRALRNGTVKQSALYYVRGF